MPKVLKSFPGDKSTQAELIARCMDGKVYEVAPDEYEGKQSSLVVGCYIQAKKAGLRVRTRRVGRNVVMQFRKP